MFIVPDKPSALHDPGEGSLNDPAPFDDNEAFGPRHSPDDFQRQVGFVLGPIHQFSGIATVGKDPLDEGVEAARAQQQALGAIPVLHVGAMHFHPQETPVGVGQDVPLAAVDFLRGVEAFPPPF